MRNLHLSKGTGISSPHRLPISSWGSGDDSQIIGKDTRMGNTGLRIFPSFSLPMAIVTPEEPNQKTKQNLCFELQKGPVLNEFCQ